MAHNVFLGIDYDDAYKAVVVSDPSNVEYRFETGDPSADWAAAKVKARELTQEFGCICMTLSSLDGFVFDVPGWKFNDADDIVRDERDFNTDGTLKTPADLEQDDEAAARLEPAEDRMPEIMGFLEAVRAASVAVTNTECGAVLTDVVARLKQANSAIAVDTAAQIVQSLVDSLSARDDQMASLINALHRISEANPRNTNSETADRMASWTQAVAQTALADLPQAAKEPTHG